MVIIFTHLQSNPMFDLVKSSREIEKELVRLRTVLSLTAGLLLLVNATLG